MTFSFQLFIPDTRTDQQKVDSLLEQFTREQDIELAHDSHEDIEVRLGRLKGQELKSEEDSSKSDLYDSEEEVEKITKKVHTLFDCYKFNSNTKIFQIKNEVALDERVPIGLTSSKSRSLEDDEVSGRTSPELPWCVLCNDDAKFRCLDCSGDLYCGECNVEVHKNWGETDHKVVPYRRPQ